MVLNPLPPQAYTKETLVKAYQWLQNQPESIKEIALTPDILVSLFTKAQMQGDQVLERPSIQNFKHELRNLAGIMTDLKEPTYPETPIFLPELNVPPITERLATSKQHLSPSPAKTQTASASMKVLERLDDHSLTMIRKAKERLNLSNDAETLRLLIALGYSKIKTL